MTLSQILEQKGIEKGIEKRNIEIARNMLKDRLPLETISKYTGLSVALLLNIKFD